MTVFCNCEPDCYVTITQVLMTYIDMKTITCYHLNILSVTDGFKRSTAKEQKAVLADRLGMP